MNKEIVLEIVLAAFASGFLSAILVKLLDILQEWINQKADEKLRLKKKKEETLDTYIQEKKNVYIEALKKLAELRSGFDITYDFPYNNERINEKIDALNQNASELSAKIRLYASDDVFSVYWELAHWRKYAYTRSSGQWRLSQESKELFSINMTLLARLMQKDLGFREYVEEPEMIVCPECGIEHDPYKTCKCGLTWKQTMDKYRESFINTIEDEQNNSDNATTTNDDI